tara:strand:+ start:486 stop:1691 length:1206 start_codon:yes stop_codon:yes gene_type:complete
MKFASINEQMDILKRGVQEIIPEEELVKKIENSKQKSIPLNIKLGCDPSRPDLHIGHGVVLSKLEQFQYLGHKAILLIGDFTAMIGDPTGQNKTRPQLTIKETKENAQSYIDQASSILDSKKLKVVYNSDWLGKMNFSDVIRLTSNYTVAQILERDDFTKRYKGGKPISVHEFLYPLAQGYDSVVLKSDVELGGTDQKFNLLVGRELQKINSLPQQVIITTPLLEGTDGIEKMSKSYNNYIGITETPNEMYGKTLSIPDSLISKYFEYVTDINNDELNIIKDDIKNNISNPRDLKRRLARKIVEFYYDDKKAYDAEENFDNLFIKKTAPSDIPEITVKDKIKIILIIVENKMASSNSEAKRLIKQGGVKIDDKKINDIHYIFEPKNCILKVGKRKFLKINL